MCNFGGHFSIKCMMLWASCYQIRYNALHIHGSCRVEVKRFPKKYEKHIFRYVIMGDFSEKCFASLLPNVRQMRPN